MGFGLFVLVNLTLFVRPGEVVPDLSGAPIYLILILGCLVVSWPHVLQTLSTLRRQPITVCVLGLWLVGILSHLSKMNLTLTAEVAQSFGRVVIYYLLLVSVVNSPARLRQFLAWILLAITLMATLTVLQYHRVIQLPGLTVVEERHTNEETGEVTFIPRVCGSGVFNDPNDLCLALTLGAVLSLYWLSDGRVGPLRFGCVPILLVLGYTLRLTQSRGGLLGFLCGLFALCWARFGWRRMVLLVLACIPGVLLMLGQRQSNFNLKGGDTGQDRIQLWAEGIRMFREFPLFGIGTGRYAEEVGLVAHNSYVHAFAEMGFLGGTLFVGAFALALWPLASLSLTPGKIADPELERLQPFVFALLAGYAGGLGSLSRNYIELTYLVLGIAQIHLGLISSRISLPVWREGLVKRVGLIGAAAIVGIYVIVRCTVRYG